MKAGSAIHDPADIVIMRLRHFRLKKCVEIFLKKLNY